MEQTEHIAKFKQIIQNAMYYARYSHEYLFDENVDNVIAMTYLQIAASKFAALESYYYSCYGILEHPEIEKLFHLFELYMSEFLRNLRTIHPHQLTDIEFQNLNDAFDTSVVSSDN